MHTCLTLASRHHAFAKNGRPGTTIDIIRNRIISMVQRLYVTCALGMCSYATDKWVFTTNQPRSILDSRHRAFVKTVDAIATVNTSAEDVFWLRKAFESTPGAIGES